MQECLTPRGSGRNWTRLRAKYSPLRVVAEAIPCWNICSSVGFASVAALRHLGCRGGWHLASRTRGVISRPNAHSAEQDARLYTSHLPVATPTHTKSCTQ